MTTWNSYKNKYWPDYKLLGTTLCSLEIIDSYPYLLMNNSVHDDLIQTMLTNCKGVKLNDET